MTASQALLRYDAACSALYALLARKQINFIRQPGLLLQIHPYAGPTRGGVGRGHVGPWVHYWPATGTARRGREVRRNQTVQQAVAWLAEPRSGEPQGAP
jgi:hypothetical protein